MGVMIWVVVNAVVGTLIFKLSPSRKNVVA